MPGFVFRLQRVLQWRRTTLTLEQSRLENLRAQERAVETARRDLIDNRLRQQRQVAEASAVTGRDLADLEAFRAWAAREEAALAARAAALQRALAEQAARVFSADRDVRLVERLKERRREAWTAEEERRIEEMANESATSEWRRKK
jgi:hypothetical protein